MVEVLQAVPRTAIDAAIQNKDNELLFLFLPKVSNKNDLECIGNYAIENDDIDMLLHAVDRAEEKIIRLIYTAYNNHRINCVTKLLDRGYTLHIRPDNNTEYDSEQMLTLTDYSEVYFPSKICEQLYQAYGTECIRKILENYHGSNRNFIQNEPDGYYADERFALVSWLIEKKNYDLIDFAAEKGVRISITAFGQEETLALDDFDESDELWNHSRRLFDGNISLYRCVSEKNINLLRYLVEREKIGKETVKHAIENRVSDEMMRLIMQHYDTECEEKLRPGTPEIWFYVLKLQDKVSIQLFFERFSEELTDETERKNLYAHFLWTEGNPEIAEILVNICHFPEVMIREAELASLIPQRVALSLVEEDYFKNKEQKKTIHSPKVSFCYFNDNTWEIKGNPSKNQWDQPCIDDLHYLVSKEKDEYIVSPYNKVD